MGEILQDEAREIMSSLLPKVLSKRVGDEFSEQMILMLTAPRHSLSFWNSPQMASVEIKRQS